MNANARMVTTAQNQPQPQTELGRIGSMIGQISLDVSGLRNRVSAMADRVVGTPPPATADGKGGPAAVPNGSIAALDEALAGLANTVRDLDREITRMDVL